MVTHPLRIHGAAEGIISICVLCILTYFTNPEGLLQEHTSEKCLAYRLENLLLGSMSGHSNLQLLC